ADGESKETQPDNADSAGGADRVRIEVMDTGLGISKDDQAAIFDRFFRVENRVHTLEGTGLGLSIVRNIMEKHHAQMHLTSEEGVGSIFWFDLAVYQAEPTDDDEPSTPVAEEEAGEETPEVNATEV
ncbi:MAG: ATP-binding protein, partial [Cyanobacteria bacterium P01_H01_bin.130]